LQKHDTILAVYYMAPVHKSEKQSSILRTYSYAGKCEGKAISIKCNITDGSH